MKLSEKAATLARDGIKQGATAIADKLATVKKNVGIKFEEVLAPLRRPVDPGSYRPTPTPDPSGDRGRLTYIDAPRSRDALVKDYMDVDTFWADKERRARQLRDELVTGKLATPARADADLRAKLTSYERQRAEALKGITGDLGKLGVSTRDLTNLGIRARVMDQATMEFTGKAARLARIAEEMQKSAGWTDARTRSWLTDRLRDLERVTTRKYEGILEKGLLP